MNTSQKAPYSEVVELTIPASSDLIVLARLTTAAIASRVGFDIEAIEDLRLAIDELCISLMDAERPSRLHLVIRHDEDSVEIACSREGPAPQPAAGSAEAEARELSIRILDALVDDHGHEIADGHARAWLKKRREPSKVG